MQRVPALRPTAQDDTAVTLIAGGILVFFVGILGSFLWAAVTAAQAPLLLACVPGEVAVPVAVTMLLLARARFRATV